MALILPHNTPGQVLKLLFLMSQLGNAKLLATH